jgi:sugar phosphate isomerase/epimerase
MLIKDFSIQLYSVRDALGQMGFPAVLERLSLIGYTGVEFAGYGGLDALEMLSLLQKNKMKPRGAHIGFERLEQALDEEIAYHRVLGTEFIIVPHAPFGNAGDVKQTAERLNALAPKIKAAGFRFAFHNHDGEFGRDGVLYRLEDMMVLSPDTEIQLDVYWAAKMDCDCAAFIRKHSGRVTSLHIKQLDKSGGNVNLGDGVLDFRELIQAGIDCGIDYFVHEQEAFAGDTFKCMRDGYKHIMSL